MLLGNVNLTKKQKKEISKRVLELLRELDNEE